MKTEESKQNLLLVDCDIDEVRDFRDNLYYHGKSFLVKSIISNWIRTGLISELKRYYIYFVTGFKFFLCRNQYDAIVGWQQFYVIIISFFCSLFHAKKTAKLIALNFTYKEKKGYAGKIYTWFIKKCLNVNYLDYIHVPSHEYAIFISKEFSYPLDRIIVAPFGVNDCYNDLIKLEPPHGYDKNSYALSIGRSNRDFDFLINAWATIDYPLVIISDKYKGDNITKKGIVIKRDIAGVDSYPWIANCNFVIIPIDDPLVCSGDTVLLNSMALKKKIIVTKPSSLSDTYIKNGFNGYTVEKNIDAFKELVESLIKEDNNTVGENARKSFLEVYSRVNFAKNLTNILTKESWKINNVK